MSRQGGRRQARVIRRWEEEDLYTPWRQVLFWQRGERRKVKRRTHKRERRDGHVATREVDE